MSEREAHGINESIKAFLEVLCKMQNPALRIADYLVGESESIPSNKALRRAAHQAEDLFNSVVSAACAAGNLLEELEEVTG